MSQMNCELLQNMYSFVVTVIEAACVRAQSCLALGDPMDCIRPGFSVNGIFQARVLE